MFKIISSYLERGCHIVLEDTTLQLIEYKNY